MMFMGNHPSACFALALVCAAPLLALAQTYPSKPIRFVVPFPAGGAGDLVVRPLAQKLSERWREPVVVDNRSGASGALGLQIAANAPADGHTLALGTASTHSINPALHRDLPYDPVKDFAPIALLIVIPNVLVAHPSLPVTSVKDLVTLAKARPGQLNYSSYGQGSIAQLAAEMMKNTAGLNIVHVVYKGAPQGLSAVIANEVQLSFPSVATGFPQVKAGRLKGLAVTSRARTPLMADTPTMVEAGIPGFEATSWLGTFFQRGTPKAIVNRVHAETVKILRIPEVKTGFESQGFEVIGDGPDEFQKFIRSEQRKYAQVVKAAKIHVE